MIEEKKVWFYMDDEVSESYSEDDYSKTVTYIEDTLERNVNQLNRLIEIIMNSNGLDASDFIGLKQTAMAVLIMSNGLIDVGYDNEEQLEKLIGQANKILDIKQNPYVIEKQEIIKKEIEDIFKISEFETI